MATASSNDTNQVVDHLFRHEYGRLVSKLTAQFGTKNFDLIEDSVQESMMRAMQNWPFKGVPDQPAAWLYRVSRNRLIDQLRRNSKIIDAELKDTGIQPGTVGGKDEISDDFLNMMLVCCHPSLKTEVQVIMVLKILCGFSIAEVARALMKSEASVQKAYSRGKEKLKEHDIRSGTSTVSLLNARLDVVLRILYLMFNEGYNASSSDQLINQDLCMEAMRLARLLTFTSETPEPEIYSLLSLMCFLAARFDSRISKDGELVTLDQQDRSLWDRELIALGNFYLNKASGRGLSTYFLQATLAANHSMVDSYEETNWENILDIYDLLLSVEPSHVTALHRLVALSKVRGAEIALSELGELEKKGVFHDYYLYYAIKADFMMNLGEFEKAATLLDQAIRLTRNSTEKIHLQKKLELLKNG